MAASDSDFVDALNAGQAVQRQVKSDERVETRQQKVDERRDILFNRSSTLFEQQQKFLSDERGLKKFGRDANRAVSMFRASSGQVYQPMIDLYKTIPDGGKFHQFRRNEDGTFDFDMEWQGQRFKKEGATSDEVGKMMMAIANPAQYLEASGAAAAAQAEHENALELKRIEILGKAKPRGATVFGGRMTLKEYTDTRKDLTEEYTEIMNSDPDTLMTPDEAGEDGLRRMTMDEYVNQEFSKIGFDFSGTPTVGEDGVIKESIPQPDPNTASFTEISQHALRSGVEPGKEVDAGIAVFIRMGRAQEALDTFGGEGDDTLTKSQLNKLKSAVAAKEADSEAGQAADASQAEINVGAPGEPAAATQDLGPVAAFAQNNKAPDFEQLKADVVKLFNFLRAHGNSLRERQGRAKAKKTWSAVASGNPERGSDAFKILLAAQTPEGKQAAAEAYHLIRESLSARVQKTLDKEFPARQSPIRNAAADVKGFSGPNIVTSALPTQ